MRLPTRSCHLLALHLLVLSATAQAQDAVQATDPLTVYRCVDTQGHVTIGDAPCAKGSDAQVRQMQRPQDGEPLARRDPAEAPPPPPPAPQVVVARAPQPMYECVTPEGTRYTSESGDGNPRWVPLWTLGYRDRWRPGPRPGPRPDASRGEAHEAGSSWGRVGAPAPRPGPSPDRRPPPRPGHGGHGHAGYGGGGTWVRDTCHSLPQGEVCARLRDRRDGIRRRFFNAQERERDTLRAEERGINARLAADCGGR